MLATPAASNLLATTDIARMRGLDNSSCGYTILQRQDMRAARVKELEALQADNCARCARKNKRIIEKLRERRWEEYRKDRQRQ